MCIYKMSEITKYLLQETDSPSVEKEDFFFCFEINLKLFGLYSTLNWVIKLYFTLFYSLSLLLFSVFRYVTFCSLVIHVIGIPSLPVILSIYSLISLSRLHRTGLVPIRHWRVHSIFRFSWRKAQVCCWHLPSLFIPIRVWMRTRAASTKNDHHHEIG